MFAAGQCVGSFEQCYQASCSSHCHEALFNVSRKAHSVTQKNEQAGSSFIIRIFSLCLGSRNRLFLAYTISIFPPS